MLGLVFACFGVALFLSLPVALGMGLATILPSMVNPGFQGNINYVVQGMVSGLNSTPTLAIPLFMLSGALMTRGGISKKLFDIFSCIVGKRTAGIPIAVVITCLFYGAISGSGPATTAAVGAMCIPILVGLGYDPVFSAAVVATAGGLGVIIPPSIPFIMYGLFTGVSVGAMFTAGIVPGCLIAFILCAYCWYYCKRHGEDKEKIAANYHALQERGFFNVFKDGFWAILTPVIILGGIYGGFVTPTEAADISVFYALIVCLFLYKTIKFKDVALLCKDAIASYGPICFMLALGTGFSRILTLLKASDYVKALFTMGGFNRFTFFLVLNICLLILGMFMDVGAAVVIFSPILLPVAAGFGISGIQLGIVMVTNLAIGFVTPPFGMNLFVAAPLANTNVATLGRRALPFIVCFIFALALITYVPWFSLCLIS